MVINFVYMPFKYLEARFEVGPPHFDNEDDDEEEDGLEFDQIRTEEIAQQLTRQREEDGIPIVPQRNVRVSSLFPVESFSTDIA